MARFNKGILTMYKKFTKLINEKHVQREEDVDKLIKASAAASLPNAEKFDKKLNQKSVQKMIDNGKILARAEINAARSYQKGTPYYFYTCVLNHNYLKLSNYVKNPKNIEIHRRYIFNPTFFKMVTEKWWFRNRD